MHGPPARKGKRKRLTLDELQEALQENELVNATPATAEPREVRDRRRARRRVKRCRLNKELRELTIADGLEQGIGEPVGEASAAIERNTLGLEESKQEDDDPDFVLARAIARDEVRSEAGGGVRDVQEARRLKRNEAARRRRALRTLSQKERDNEAQRLRYIQRRLNLAGDQLDEARAHRANAEAQRRSIMTDEQREEVRSRQSENEANRRASMSDNQREEERIRRSQNEAQRRASLTDDQRERQQHQRRTRKYRKALANHEDFTSSSVAGKYVADGRHQLPDPTSVCESCGAWKWPDESKVACCTGGLVKLPPLQPAPTRLRELYKNEQFRSLVRVYNQVFAFTSVGASFSNRRFQPVAEDRSVQGQHGVYTYRIQGAMGHYMGSLLPYIDPATGVEGEPKFAQIYVYDPVMEKRAARRQGIFHGLDGVVMLDLEQIMETHNPFAREFITMGQRMRTMIQAGSNPVDVVFRLHANNHQDPRRYNLPTATEVSAVVVQDGNTGNNRDLLLFPRGGGLLRLFETHAIYDPLQYPLLFPYGELGWTYTDQYVVGELNRNKREMALREHVAYRLYQKVDDESVLHQGGRLFQQYVVDQRAKCEQEILRYIASHQKELRADLYMGVRDAYINENVGAFRNRTGVIGLASNEGLVSEYHSESGQLVYPNSASRRHFLEDVGQRVVLPASFTGGDRYMYEQYQDAMAMVREFGKPDLFMTVTCNPKWTEITEVVEKNGPHQSAQDRPDVVARVWHQKLKSVLKDLDDGVFGFQVARIFVVEFQKRGLPHAHILIILAEEDKPRSRQDFDKFVSAELPDEVSNPALYSTVLSSMIHGPCGALNPNSPCMKDGICSKGFPKPLSEVTQTNHNGYPVYRRRRRPEGVLKHKGKEFDNATLNQWIVPYNPYFSQKYDCHINVEVCSTITAVKYLYKYVYKGADMTEISVQALRQDTSDSEDPSREPNEIIRYLKGRYISPVEACQRLFEYPIQGKTHSVQKLPVHVPDCQFVVYQGTDDPESVLSSGRHTKLTRFFELAATNPEARNMLYQDIPKLFRWDKKEKNWFRYRNRQRSIGRMVHCSPRDPERFYLRLLLCHRPGPTSYEDLRTVDGHLYSTFKDAAMHAGFLESDQEWVECLREASLYQMPRQLRQLFATILLYSMPADCRVLWNQFFPEFSRDFEYAYRTEPNKDEMVLFKTMLSLHSFLEAGGMTLADFPDLPQLSEFPHLVLLSHMDNNLIRREMEGYDRNELRQIVDNVGGLNENQRQIYDEIVGAVMAPASTTKLYFVDGPGGTGKSTLLRHVLAKVRLEGKIAIAVASSGIASLLLPGGRTAHSTFKIPIKLGDTSTCFIRKQSKLKQLLQQASLIVWDEAPMSHRFAFEAVDRTLQDVLDCDEPFGGKVVVLSGDFRQILPVVKRGTPADTVQACIRSSALWAHFKQLRLTVNMRVRCAADQATAAELSDFADFLLKVGEGRHEVDEDLGPEFIKLPSDILIGDGEDGHQPGEQADDEFSPISIGLKKIVNAMYNERDLNDPAVATDEYFANRTILTTTNAAVQRVNEAVTERLHGETQVYLSTDSVEDDEGEACAFFEREVLNALNINGIPPHQLILKKGSPIMLMRNLNPEAGLCNGTRLRVSDMKPHVIRATIMTGTHCGKEVLIPRIIFISDDDVRDFPFRLRRKQFPVIPAFAMTINKAQGQTVHNLGLYLQTPCFSHGQLYVALSRVTSRAKIKVLIENSPQEDSEGAYTSNIVYRQIFE